MTPAGLRVTRFADEAATGALPEGPHVLAAYKGRRLRVYEPGALPGFLQTPLYCESVQGFWGEFLRDGRPGPAVAAAARQRPGDRLQALLDAGTTVDVVLEEAALLTFPSGLAQGDMHAQVCHVLDVVGRFPAIGIAVIPLGVPRPVPPVAPFTIFGAPGRQDGSPSVAVSFPSFAAEFTSPRDVYHYERLFNVLRGAAVGGVGATTMIRDAVTRLGPPRW